MKGKISFNSLEAVICDFDGVLTDNRVYFDQNGREMVVCSRADGLAFNILKKHGIIVYILSMEKNPVVVRRAKKLKVPAFVGITNKWEVLKKLARKEKFLLDRTLYIGNDINDLEAMRECGWRACPADAYVPIKRITNIVLKSRGGEGVVRELVGIMLGENIINK